MCTKRYVQKRSKQNWNQPKYLLPGELIIVIYSPTEYYTAILNYMNLRKIMLKVEKQVQIYIQYVIKAN